MASEGVDVQEILRREMADGVRREKAAAARGDRGGARPAPGTPAHVRRAEAIQFLAARPDTRELMKSALYDQDTAVCRETHAEANRPCPKEIYGVSDQYVILDSFSRNFFEGDLERGEIAFNFNVQSVTTATAIGVKDVVDTVIGLQVGEFCLPLPPLDRFAPAEIVAHDGSLAGLNLADNSAVAGVLPAGDAVTNPQSQVPFCQRVTLFFREIGLQSMSLRGNRRGHFELGAAVAPTGDRVQLTPMGNCEDYLFTDPVKDIHGLTLQLLTPDRPLSLPPDTLRMVTARADSTGRLELTARDLSPLVNLAVDDRIFVEGFASGNGLLDRHVNRPEGHLVGAAAADSGTGLFDIAGPAGGSTTTPVPGAKTATAVFRLNPDPQVTGLTVVDAAGAPVVVANGDAIRSSSEIVVRIAKNRVRIPLRMRRIVDRLTNYVSPSSLT